MSRLANTTEFQSRVEMVAMYFTEKKFSQTLTPTWRMSTERRFGGAGVLNTLDKTENPTIRTRK